MWKGKARMLHSYRFRLYPGRNQEAELLQTLGSCRWLFNHMLQRKNEGWTYPKIQAEIPNLVKEQPFLVEVHSKTRQYVLWQLRANIKSLGLLKKKGRKVGSIRFRGKGRYKTFVYNQTGFKLIPNGRRNQKLHLSKIGEIPIRLHRKIDGTIKQVIIKHSETNKWFAIFSVDIGPEKLGTTNKAIGIDLNIENYLTDSSGKKIEHPHTLLKLENKLAREQRILAKKKKGSKNRFRQRIRTAKIYEEIVDKRNDFLHKLSTHYIQNYDFIAVEDLAVKEMIESSYNAKNKVDSSWSTFLNMLSCKAESAGRTLVKIDPKNTSQMCSRCGNYVYVAERHSLSDICQSPNLPEATWAQKSPCDFSGDKVALPHKQIWIRRHNCPSCGLDMDRDYNSAINILKKALSEVGQGLPELTPVEIKPLPSPWEKASLVVRNSKEFRSYDFPLENHII